MTLTMPTIRPHRNPIWRNSRRPGVHTRKQQLAYLLMRYRVQRCKAPAFLRADFAARKGL